MQALTVFPELCLGSRSLSKVRWSLVEWIGDRNERTGGVFGGRALDGVGRAIGGYGVT